MTKLSNPVDTIKTIIPPIVNWLGYGGLLPFLALAAAVWVDSSRSSLWVDILLVYGSVILSFVAALGFCDESKRYVCASTYPLFRVERGTSFVGLGCTFS